MEKKEFYAVFQLSKTKVFYVDYETVGGNDHPYFATRAGVFCKNKLDWRTVGQCQSVVTDGYPEAKAFFRKWDRLHLHDLSEAEYAEMQSDLDALKERYNFLYGDREFGFYTVAEWSKMEPKKAVRSNVREAA